MTSPWGFSGGMAPARHNDMQEGALSISTELGDLARQKLREAIAIYGRSVFQEPRRCEAILRDCCPTAPREVFLLVSALRENVAEELVSHEHSLPATAVVARLTRRLSDQLGLSEDSARWAVDSWRYGLEDNPGLRAAPDPVRFARQSPWAASASGPISVDSTNSAVNWPWLGTCLVTLASAVVSLGGMAWITFVHQWKTWQGGLVECAALALLLAGTGFCQLLARRAFEQMPPPDHHALHPRTAAFALLPEVLILLLLPLVAIGLPAMWILEWSLELHAAGLPHATLFHVIRAIESLWLSAFLYYWVRGMTPIQGRIACSLIRQR